MIVQPCLVFSADSYFGQGQAAPPNLSKTSIPPKENLKHPFARDQSAILESFLVNYNARSTPGDGSYLRLWCPELRSSAGPWPYASIREKAERNVKGNA